METPKNFVDTMFIDEIQTPAPAPATSWLNKIRTQIEADPRVMEIITIEFVNEWPNKITVKVQLSWELFSSMKWDIKNLETRVAYGESILVTGWRDGIMFLSVTSMEEWEAYKLESDS